MGDVLVKFNGKPVTDFYDLPRLLAEDVIDKETKLTIIRRENLIEITIVPTVHGERRRLINRMPLEIEPPSPMHHAATCDAHLTRYHNLAMQALLLQRLLSHLVFD